VTLRARNLPRGAKHYWVLSDARTMPKAVFVKAAKAEQVSSGQAVVLDPEAHARLPGDRRDVRHEPRRHQPGDRRQERLDRPQAPHVDGHPAGASASARRRRGRSPSPGSRRSG
jgi:hypothetical protein